MSQNFSENSIKMNKTIFVGSRGVSHPAWCEGFYPDDLPLEWRLSYYGNEFRALLLLQDDINSLSREEVVEWLEDLNDDFRLLYELEFDSFSVLSSLPVELVRRLQGVVCSVTTAQLDLLLEQTILLPAEMPFYLRCLGDVPSAEQVEQLTARGWQLCWQPDWPHTAACAPILFLDGCLSLRELRVQVQQFLASDAIESDDLVLLLEGDSPSVEYLHQCQLLVDLLT